MIPEFPQFTPLRLGHRAEVKALTRRFPPYSDFNFTSLYSWDTNETICVSMLDGNLVVRFVDYTSQEPFYSFLGDRNVDETARRVLELARAEGLRPELKLIPETVATHLHDRSLRATYDDDNRDYILSVDRLKRYVGNKLGPKRNFVNRFNRSYEAVTVRVTLADVAVQTRMLDLYHRWLLQKGDDAENPENELLALHRVMFAARYLEDLYVIATFIDDDLAAFAINEVVGEGFGMIHFEKADSSYTGVYAHLMQQMAWGMEAVGCKFINYEQDLGIYGLRKGKASYVPSGFLRKYVVGARTSSLRAAMISERPIVMRHPGAELVEEDAPEPMIAAEFLGEATRQRPVRYSIPPLPGGKGVQLPPLFRAWNPEAATRVTAFAGDLTGPRAGTIRPPTRTAPLGGVFEESRHSSLLPPAPSEERPRMAKAGPVLELPAEPPMRDRTTGIRRSYALAPPPNDLLTLLDEDAVPAAGDRHSHEQVKGESSLPPEPQARVRS
jgi:hypothetical protein